MRGLSEGSLGYGIIGPRILDYGEPVYGGRLRVQGFTPLIRWDPHDVSIIATPWIGPATSTLLQSNAWTFDRFDVIGNLAESWTMDNAEGTLWTFNINPQAAWWDGSQVSMEDVIYSFGRMAGTTPNHDGDGEFKTFVAQHWDRIEKVDENKVRIFLRNPWADFVGYMANDNLEIVQQAHYEQMDANQAATEDDIWTALTGWQNLLGSGPFIPDSVADRSTWSLDKNPIYWRTDPDGRNLPYLDGLDYFAITDRSAAQAAWEVEQVWLAALGSNGNMQPGQMNELIERGQGKFMVYPVPCCPFGFAVNTSKPPFDDPKVRKAVNLVLDRDAFNEFTWAGLAMLGTVCGPPGHPLCMAQEEVLALPGWREPKDQDIAEARRLMAEVGLEDGFTTSLVHSQQLNEVDAAPVFKDLMARVLNVDVDIISLDQVTWGDTQRSGQYDVITSGSGAGVLTPDHFLNSIYILNNVNGWRYDGPSIGEPEEDLLGLIAEQSRALDVAERRAIVRRIEEIVLTKDSYYFHLFNRTFGRLFNADKISGEQPRATGYSEEIYEQLWLNNP